MFGIAFNERFDEGSFAHAWRANNGGNDRRWFGGKAVDKGNMEALFLDLNILLKCPSLRGGCTECTS